MDVNSENTCKYFPHLYFLRHLASSKLLLLDFKYQRQSHFVLAKTFVDQQHYWTTALKRKLLLLLSHWEVPPGLEDLDLGVQLDRGSKLDAQVMEDIIALQEQQGATIDLLEKIHVDNFQILIKLFVTKKNNIWFISEGKKESLSKTYLTPEFLRVIQLHVHHPVQVVRNHVRAPTGNVGYRLVRLVPLPVLGQLASVWVKMRRQQGQESGGGGSCCWGWCAAAAARGVVVPVGVGGNG